MPRILLIFILATFFSGAYALQLKSVKDNEAVLAKISSKDLSQIFVLNDRILNTRGINGAYELIKDEQQGVIFIKPSMAYQHKAFNIFLSTEQGHSYNLLLTPMDIPAENIELKPLSPANVQADRWERNSPYLETLIQLINNMENDLYPEGYAVIDINKCKANKITSNVTAELVTLYRGHHLQGEIWLIKNKGSETANLKLHNFFKNGIRAVAIEDEVLAGGDETYVYKVVDYVSPF